MHRWVAFVVLGLAALWAQAAETVSVDPSLFTTQIFQWKDAARDRSVPAKLYLPASAQLGEGTVPLVVFSHGIGGSKDGYSYLGRYFAAQGYASLHVQNGSTVSVNDPRFGAAILISAPPFYGLGDPLKIVPGIDVPTLHITATADDIQIPGYRSGVADRLALYQATGAATQAAKVLAVFKDGSHSIFTDRMGTGGVALNPQVKVATRQLALAFLTWLHG